jgi:hypothetical protein
MAKSSRKKVSVTSPSEDDEAAINRGVEVETRERVWMDGTRVPDAETRRGFARRRRDAVSADAALDTARACIGASGCGACCWRSSLDTAGQEVGRELKRFSAESSAPVTTGAHVQARRADQEAGDARNAEGALGVNPRGVHSRASIEAESRD